MIKRAKVHDRQLEYFSGALDGMIFLVLLRLMFAQWLDLVLSEAYSRKINKDPKT